MMASFRERLPQTLAIDLVENKRQVHILMATPHGPMLVILDRRRVSASNPHQLLVLMIVTGILMTGSPICSCATRCGRSCGWPMVAEAFGKGRRCPTAARRDRGAGGGARVSGHAPADRARDRAAHAAAVGVSHDLRTPLTRLKLGLAMLEEEEEAALRRDVEDMERLLDAFLGFVRSDALDDPVNMGYLLHPLGDPRIAGFEENTDRVNRVADRSNGFVWRMKDEDLALPENDCGRLFGRPDVALATLSVWESYEDFDHFVHKTIHGAF
jgi:hypothetical protein